MTATWNNGHVHKIKRHCFYNMQPWLFLKYSFYFLTQHLYLSPVLSDCSAFAKKWWYRLIKSNCEVDWLILLEWWLNPFLIYILLVMGWNLKIPALGGLAVLTAFDLKCFLDEDGMNAFFGKILQYNFYDYCLNNRMFYILLETL